MRKKIVAEFVGTFFLVLIGTGSIVLNEKYNGFLGVIGIAIAFGAIVTTMILLFGKTSGAHINPAVTLGFTILGVFPKKDLPTYVTSQLSGAAFASLLIHFFYPSNQNLGNTIPSGSLMESFILETVLTFILMLVILIVSNGYKESGYIPAIAIGLVVFLEANFAGPICGASMNPARTFGPALVSGNLYYLWIYILAPIIGAAAICTLWKNDSRKKIFNKKERLN